MTWLLDTNAVSALMKGDPAVVERLRRASKSEVMVPQPVFAEIAYGIERLPASRRKRSLRQRFRAIRAELSTCVWTNEVSDEFGLGKAALERDGNRLEISTSRLQRTPSPSVQCWSPPTPDTAGRNGTVKWSFVRMRQAPARMTIRARSGPRHRPAPG